MEEKAIDKGQPSHSLRHRDAKAHEAGRRGIEIASNYRLGQVYNYINLDKTSQVFVYEGVQFWREDFQFVFSFKEKRFVGGDIVPFEEFLEMLREQKG